MALIGFSGFCCASSNFRSVPAAAAESLMEMVLAVPHPLSAPTWEKPRTIFFSAAGVLPVSLLPQAARLAANRPTATPAITFLNTVGLLGGGRFVVPLRSAPRRRRLAVDVLVAVVERVDRVRRDRHRLPQQA